MDVFQLCRLQNPRYFNKVFIYYYVYELPVAYDNVETILQDITHFAKNTNSLIILDDCAASKDVKNRTSELVKLGFSGRHIAG